MTTAATAAIAQTAGAGDQATPTASGTMLDQVVVTATKQSRAQLNQNVPVTISAFSAQQIEAQKLTTIQNLAYSVPNVSFESPGSTKGTANFSIRGLGLNSSIASTAPTVGVFVNGMYLGVNQGVLLDTFDLEGIEILRGPQGTLFGRNVTGGAVLLNNRKPSQAPDLKLRARLQSGPEYSLSAAGGGGITDTLSGRLAVLFRHDSGYFNDVTLGDKHFGKDEETIVRPSIRFQSGGTDVTLFGEYGRQTGDGPVDVAPDYAGGTLSTPGTGPRLMYHEYNKVYENFRGTNNQWWYNFILNGTQEVPFGRDGQIANITGYRKFSAYSEYASDGTPLTVSHNAGYTTNKQFSEELRYNGGFGPVTVTAGGYFFWQSLTQLNTQFAINSTQGGHISEHVYAAFGQADWHVTDQLTLQVGGRYTSEKKDADISPLSSETGLPRAGTFGIPGQCHIALLTCHYQYTGLSQKSTNFSPKVTLQYRPMEHVQLYGTWQKAFRSGGFNVRYNSPGAPPPYNPEKQQAWEAGFKTDLFDRKTRFNGAVFLTKIRNLQRDITLFDNVTLANRTFTANTADARVKGFELEFVQQVIPHVVVNANVGYVKAKYTNILFDITQDGVVNQLDYKQRLPRVSPWTGNVGLTADHDFGFGVTTFQANYSYRDPQYFPDYNTNRRDGAIPKLPVSNLLDLQLSWEPRGSHLTLTAYAKNVTDSWTISSFTPIVYPTLKGCACLANKGRIIGVEALYGF